MLPLLGGADLILVWGTKIPYAAWGGQKFLKQRSKGLGVLPPSLVFPLNFPSFHGDQMPGGVFVWAWKGLCFILYIYIYIYFIYIYMKNIYFICLYYIYICCYWLQVNINSLCAYCNWQYQGYYIYICICIIV